MEMTITTSSIYFRGFNDNLANAIWNIAVDNAPEDTGNLKRNISRTASTYKRIEIFYNAFNAPYLHYLEMAMGPIKKHKGYIEVKTIEEVFYILVIYFKSGLNMIYKKPDVKLSISKHGPMFSERKLLKEMKQSVSTLNADERMQLGQIYSRSVIGSNQRTSRRGMQVDIERVGYTKRETKTFDLFYTTEKLY